MRKSISPQGDTKAPTSVVVMEGNLRKRFDFDNNKGEKDKVGEANVSVEQSSRKSTSINSKALFEEKLSGCLKGKKVRKVLKKQKTEKDNEFLEP